MDLHITILLGSLVGSIAIALGIISSGIYTRLTRTPPTPIRGCDQCGTKLTATDGTSCTTCVTRRRHAHNTTKEQP